MKSCWRLLRNEKEVDFHYDLEREYDQICHRMGGLDWQPIGLTFQLAAVTTLLLLLVCIPLSYWLAYTQNRLKPVAEALVSLPLVLPPTVLGFYLLMVFSPTSWVGVWLHNVLGIRLVFSFPGLVVASMIYSLPFMVQPLQAGFSRIPTSLHEAAHVLGRTRLQTLLQVLLPNMRPSLLTGIVLAFAHTIGEFGVVLMIGGNLPGQTKVASIAIFDATESLDYETAHAYSLVLLLLSFGVLLLVYGFNGKYLRREGPW